MASSGISLRARLAAPVVVLALCAAACVSVSIARAPAAQADTAPAAGTPGTVSADPLPTVQQNGVIWAQVTVGNTVYAAGKFTQTWPAGSTNTSANDTARSNLLAYDITTGKLTSFNFALDQQALAIAASPDGTKLYVGGDFTTVNGTSRNRFATFDIGANQPNGGVLDTTIKPSFSGEVSAVAPSPDGSKVYLGGNYFNVNSVSRMRLAAISVSTGALLPWAPTADDNAVTAMVVTPDNSEVVIGGRFSSLNGASTPGLGAVTAVNATAVPYAITSAVQDFTAPNSASGQGAGIESLTTDGTQVYGSGYSYQQGNFEGSFGVDPNSGRINFLNDCHGDTYSVYPIGQVLYTVSHVHDCTATGNFPDTNPRVNWHANAWTTNPTGTNVGPDSYGWNYNGVPDSTLLQWYPKLAIGSVTGQSQAAWSVTGNSQYIALGGEFPSANGVAQQGIVRYAVKSAAPNKVGPTAMSSLTPKAVSFAKATARVTWQATWDQDNANLTYNLLRDGSSTPIYTVTQASNFWQMPMLGYFDSGLAVGSSHTYRVQVIDPSGNKISSSSSVAVTISNSGSSGGAYTSDVRSDGATDLWRLNEASGSTGYDSAGFTDLVQGTGVTDGVAGPLSTDSSTAAGFDGTTNGTASTTSAITGPNTFSAESWFQTSSNSGGKIVGFGDTTAPNTSSNYDRQIYLDNAGHVVFGVFSGGVNTITSAKTYNNGAWHHVVGELSAAGMALYVDGRAVGTNQGTTAGQPFTGYWRVGGDNLGGWPNQPSSNNLAGNIADVAIYPTALSVQQVQKHYTDAGNASPVAPAPTDAYGKAVYNDNPLLYWRADDAAGSASAVDTSAYGNAGAYSGGIIYRSASPVTGSGGTGVTLNGSDGALSSSQTYNNPTSYSEELWFNTSTANGGKLIGFGDAATGLSSNYDRHVYMLNSGQLEFGTYTGQTNTIISPNSYNDGQWHQLVASQGATGMSLYVDGQVVGTNPQTGAQNYTGYWRVGGDRTWGGASSDYFAGTIDEVAVYGSQLSASQVQAHYRASPAATTPPPTAVIGTPSCTNLSCTFDGTGSTDPNGTITGYSWDFGDSAAGATGTPTHTFKTAGSYTVTLTVTDSLGKTAATTTTVVVTAPAAPTAVVATPSCGYLTCGFDGTGSSAASGATVTAFGWSFGDGSMATGVKPSHTFAAAGTFSVALTVTDSNGASATATVTVTVTAAPVPTATIATPICTNLSCDFDGTGSTATGGTVASYAWDFGDSSTSTAAKPTHAYAAPGTFVVKLVVVDSNGATSSAASTAVTVSGPPAAPVASFTASCPSLTCAFDGSSSTDPAGAAITGYAWTFGDGKTASGVTSTNTYGAAGSYSVKLTITDANGQSSSVTQTVSAAPSGNPAIKPYATDAFNRTQTSGWGNADTGGAWTSTTTSSANLSVANGSGALKMSAPGSNPGAYLAGVSTTDSSTMVNVTTNAAPTGNGTYVDVVGRRVSSTSDYRGRAIFAANGTVTLALISVNGGTTTTLKSKALTGFSYTPGGQLQVQLVVTGTSPTTLNMKAWPIGTTQPSAWQLTASDSTSALQARGSVGLTGYLPSNATTSPVTMLVNTFSTGPSNGLPTASFAAACSGKSCSTDGTTSTDPSGTITSYAWNWGDGVVTSGAMSSHGYGAAGTYAVTLTVTDPSGYTSVATRSVTVAA